jgi:hypothetical protein
MLQPFPEKSKDDQIRDEFLAVGGAMGTRSFAVHCIDVGFWSDDELLSFQVGEAQNKIRVALKHFDRNGLPFAGQTTARDDENAPVWTVRQLWLFPDYELNVHELVTQRDTLHDRAVKLCHECRERFGHAPSLNAVAAVSAAD